MMVAVNVAGFDCGTNEMDLDHIDQLGVAGYVDDDLRALISTSDLELDDFYELGLAGPITPELLRVIVTTGGLVDVHGESMRLSEAVHAVIAGPLDPDDLLRMFELGLSDVVAAAFASGRAPFDDAASLLRAVAAP